MGNKEYFFGYMKELLGDEYEAFEEACADKPRHKALRVNTLKISAEDFCALKPDLKPNPLCSGSFYFGGKPSFDPLYHAGLYYMQEPSATAAVTAFEPYIGDAVLDLCAAPGGKSTQAAAVMNGRGVLFCNDVDYKRVRALCENIERLGVKNAVVTCNGAADYIDKGFEETFDTVIADVPCSGGGMMRYEDVPYTADIVNGCAMRQRGILSNAVRLLRRGGYMLYSTCTFAKEENEDNIEYLRSLGMETVDIPLRAGETRGINERNARRIYPHNFDGEGHFYCVLRKIAGGVRALETLRAKCVIEKTGGLELECLKIGGRAVLAADFPDPDGLNVVRMGTAVKNENGETSHALVHALGKDECVRFGSVELSYENAMAYLKGCEVNVRAEKGELVAAYKGYALGLVRSAQSGDGRFVLKNKYPKALRLRQTNFE